MLITFKNVIISIICEIINVIINDQILISETFNEYFNYDKENWFIYYDSREIMNSKTNKIFTIFLKKNNILKEISYL